MAINQQISRVPGKHLVFVRYWPPHTFKEWVYNSADIDGSRIVWARDLGSTENQKLLRYYPDRTVWLLEPDFRPPRLAPINVRRGFRHRGRRGEGMRYFG